MKIAARSFACLLAAAGLAAAGAPELELELE